MSDVPEGKAKEQLERLESDKYYFFAIQGALASAYANGIEGAQWLIDNLGLHLSSERYGRKIHERFQYHG